MVIPGACFEAWGVRQRQDSGTTHARSGSTYTKTETIQRRLAWSLHKDDTQILEVFHIFGGI